MGNPGTNPEAHPPRVRGSRRGLGRAACAGLVVLACTFAVAGQARQTRDIDNLDDAVDRLALELVHEGKLEGKKVLVSPRYFFERWNERSLRLSAHLAAKFASAAREPQRGGGVGQRRIRCDDSAGGVDHRARVGESASVRGGQEAGDREAAGRRRGQRAQGRCAQGQAGAPREHRRGVPQAGSRIPRSQCGAQAREGYQGQSLVDDRRYRVHIGSFKGTNTTQPERVRQRLIRQLGPAVRTQPESSRASTLRTRLQVSFTAKSTTPAIPSSSASTSSTMNARRRWPRPTSR